MIDEGIWAERKDLAAAFLEWSAYAYGGGVEGQGARKLLEARLAAADAVVQNQDNREHDIFDSDDYLQDHGGMIATIRSLRGGEEPKAWFGDSANPADPKVRSLAEYRDQMREIVRQGLVDIMLMSASTSEVLTIRERLFDNSHITPAARANDTTDIHLMAGGTYAAAPSRPFQSTTIDHIQAGKLDPTLGGPPLDLSNRGNLRRTVYARISRHRLDATLALFGRHHRLARRRFQPRPEALPLAMTANRSKTIAAFGAVYIFFVKPALDTTEEISDRAFDTSNQIRDKTGTRDLVLIA